MRRGLYAAKAGLLGEVPPDMLSQAMGAPLGAYFAPSRALGVSGGTEAPSQPDRGINSPSGYGMYPDINKTALRASW